MLNNVAGFEMNWKAALNLKMIADGESLECIRVKIMGWTNRQSLVMVIYTCFLKTSVSHIDYSCS